MAFRYVDAILQALHKNAALHSLVDGNLFKFKSLEESETGLGRSTHKSLISVELRSWPGSKEVTEPVPVIDIRSRNGAEYCLEIAKTVKDIIDDGISEVIDGVAYVISISSLDGDLTWDKTLLAWRLIYVVKGIIYNPATVMSLTPSLTSPQKLDNKVIWFCACPEATTQEIQYRFSLNGPRTGNIWQDMTGWTPQAYWLWVVSASDIGSNQVKVEVRNSQGLPSVDASSTASYTILANALPVLSSLTPSLASPQTPKVSVSFTAEASDAEGDWILYRFWRSGPGTGGVWQDQTGWQTENRWVWNPRTEDVGTSQVKVEIIDQMHAGRSGYDATETISFEIQDNGAPTIENIIAAPTDTPAPGSPIDIICITSVVETDEILYKFILTGPGTLSESADKTGWQNKNSWTWTPTVDDIGANTVGVMVRDGKHAGPGGYDGYSSVAVTVSLPSAPVLSSVAFSPGSPQFVGKTIEMIATVQDATNEVLYKVKDMHFSAPAEITSPYQAVDLITILPSGLGFGRFADGSMARTQTSGVYWDVLDGPEFDYIQDIAVFPNGVVIVSGAHSDDSILHISRSTDEGDSFDLVFTYPSGDAEAICGLEVHSSGVALAFTEYDGKVLRTPDFGANWTIAYSSSFEAVYGGFCIFDNGVCLGGYDALIRSPNWGVDWAEITIPEIFGTIQGLACIPSTGYALIGVMFGQLFMTDDRGLTVSRLDFFPYDVYGVVQQIHLQSDGLTVFNVDNALYISTEFGARAALYYSVPVVLDVDAIMSLTVIPGKIWLSATTNMVFHSYQSTYDNLDLTNWQDKNSYSWDLARYYIGFNLLKIMVRDGEHAGPLSYDSYQSYAFNVNEYAVPTVSAITPYPASPQVPEQTIRFSAVATDPNNEGLILMYRFWLQGPGTGSAWQSQTGWQTTNQWTWRPDIKDTGANNIKVEVRNGKLAGPGSYDATRTIVYTINS